MSDFFNASPEGGDDGKMSSQCKYHFFLSHSQKYHQRADSAVAHACQVVGVAKSPKRNGMKGRV